MSGEVKQGWGQQRAVWDLTKEQVLLDLFDETRHDPAMRTDRGLKAHGWKHVAEEMNKQCSTTFNVDQLKSKYARLLMDYELFKDVGGERSLSEQAWDKLILDMPENAKRLRQFKDDGFPHVDVCRRIAVGKEELTATTAARLKQEKAVHKPISTVLTVKRSSAPDAEVPNHKRACVEAQLESATSWSMDGEKLLLFLCWKAKSDREKIAQEGVERNVWLKMTMELNKHCKTNLSKKQVKDKYLQLMQVYDLFKRVTGFSGDLEKIPKSDQDWDLLLHGCLQFSLELQRLKNKGGFPHVQVCSLIAGDTPSDGVESASLSNFLATGALQQPRANNVPSVQQSANAVANAQASLSTDALLHLLPAPASTLTPPPPTAASNRQPGPAETAAPQPPVLTQELHDNLNMFLKTATAYLVMLINDHNQEGGL